MYLVISTMVKMLSVEPNRRAKEAPPSGSAAVRLVLVLTGRSNRPSTRHEQVLVGA